MIKRNKNGTCWKPRITRHICPLSPLMCLAAVPFNATAGVDSTAVEWKSGLAPIGPASHHYSDMVHMMNEQRSETTHACPCFGNIFGVNNLWVQNVGPGLWTKPTGRGDHLQSHTWLPQKSTAKCFCLSWNVMDYIIYIKSGLNFLNISDSGHIFPSFRPWLENLMTQGFSPPWWARRQGAQRRHCPGNGRPQTVGTPPSLAVFNRAYGGPTGSRAELEKIWVFHTTITNLGME